MIFGIGTDIIEISRIEQAMKRNPKILQRLFTELELSYFQSRNMNIQHIAGGFSAKEAILKALGTGLKGLSWTELEIVRETSGKPIVRLRGKAAEYAARNHIGIIHISISHCQQYAAATAVAELSNEST